MSHIQRAIDQLGSVTALAGGLEVSVQAVCFWRDGKRTIPADKCPSIERLTGGVVRCEELRPDVDWAQVRGNTLPAPMPAGA